LLAAISLHSKEPVRKTDLESGLLDPLEMFWLACQKRSVISEASHGIQGALPNPEVGNIICVPLSESILDNSIGKEDHLRSVMKNGSVPLRPS
jgi:hypothetical protein